MPMVRNSAAVVPTRVMLASAAGPAQGQGRAASNRFLVAYGALLDQRELAHRPPAGLSTW